MLTREGKHISRIGIALRVPTEKDVRTEAKLADYPVSASETKHAEELVEQALLEELGRVEDVLQKQDVDVDTKVQLLIKKLDNDQERQQALQELAKLGEHAVDMLVQTMERGDWRDGIQDNSWRYEIADTLASIGRAATPRLIKSLGHENYWVRMAAIEALGKIKDTAL